MLGHRPASLYGLLVTNLFLPLSSTLHLYPTIQWRRDFDEPEYREILSI